MAALVRSHTRMPVGSPPSKLSIESCMPNLEQDNDLAGRFVRLTSRRAMGYAQVGR